MTPGEIIKTKLADKGWTQDDLSKILGRPLQTINEIITGKKSITPETATGLAFAFGDDPEMWMRTENAYRLSLVKSDPAVSARARLFDVAPVKEMEGRNWIRKSETVDELEQELCSFFGVRDLNSEPQINVSTRRSVQEAFLNAPQRAWCFRAKQLAKLLPAAEFSQSAFNKGVEKLRQLAAWPEETRKVSRVLSEMGIRFVIVQQLKKTRIDGAALWLDENSPVIALSLRYDRIDSFWHTLTHELSHVKHKDSNTVDIDLVGEKRRSLAELDQIELRADREAASTLIPSEVLDDFVSRTSPLYSRVKINQFANRIRIHPGIIVGQLQHRGELSYSTHRPLLVKVRDIVTSECMTDGWGHCLSIKD
ncbi:helix-turn-helix domain-containing protein [Gimesia algae]|uniref:Putative HTH-type transcriptional regulator YddM n=1 Tax=Gimesia algae TaxID=2527971 RepID=A0A517VMP6_9PLAN|nr:helix-turn-helix domain-containing protein [Gimesia algae]QDT94287.1 putative HTH-type transcriptional regulator YddM [Gimesia algae]